MSQDATQNRFLRGTSRALAAAGDFAHIASQRVAARNAGETLEGDRWVEWSFCTARLSDGPRTTLDFGADIGFLSLLAAQKGHEVVALDRYQTATPFAHERISFEHGDILERPLAGRRFDEIINCSSIEHVGLAGRYGNLDRPDGDVAAMAILRDMLAPGGRHLLTIPVGRDMVCAPRHRIYGEERLPKLLAGYRIEEQQYWLKRDGRWHLGDEAEALGTHGSASFYSLGLFVLSAAP